MDRRTIAALLLAAGLLLTACSGDTEDEAPSESAPTEAAAFPEDHFSERDVRDHLNMGRGDLAPLPDGGECEVAVILTSPDTVALYRDAGDVVATDPQQRVGVKLGWNEDQEACHASLTEALADF